MELLLVVAVAGGASLLTFFSGFGLGTLLLPVLAALAPVEAAVMMTAMVHLANNLFKLALLWRHARVAVVARFGLPAVLGALAGAWVLLGLSQRPPVFEYRLAGWEFAVAWTGLVVGGLVVVMALKELRDLDQGRSIHPRWLPLGGLGSGFFGGLSGHQGALRSAFLIGCGLGREGFVATGVAIACLVDVARLSVYLPAGPDLVGGVPATVLVTATLGAFAGALLGRRLLRKMSLAWLHRLVGWLLLGAGLALMAGLY